jgi:RimJ/RimL family protein N-acetyltransferase
MTITFSPLTCEDFPLLAMWLARPHVRAWWPDPDPTVESVAEHYGPRAEGADSTAVFLIRLDDTPIGLIQTYLHADDPEWDRAVGLPGVAGIDYLIGEPDLRGRGIGPAAIRAFAPLVFDRFPHATGIAAVPLAANRASCRALEKAGFHHLHDRDLPTTDPSDAGINAVYLLPRP